MLKRMLPALLLPGAALFGAEISNLDLANTSTSTLLATGMLGRGGFSSYVLLMDRSGAAGGGATAPALRVQDDNSTPVVTTGGVADSTVAQPVLMLSPNMGFQVILTADFSNLGAPGAPIVNPGKLVGLTDPNPVVDPSTSSDGGVLPVVSVPVVTEGGAAAAGISNSFVNAPVLPSAVSDAGAIFTGDTANAPSVIASPAVTDGVTGPVNTPATATDDPAAGNPAAQKPEFLGDPSAAAAAIPEPSTVFGVASALFGLGLLKARQRTRK